MNQNWILPVAIIAILILCLCCLVGIILGAGWLMVWNVQTSPGDGNASLGTSTPTPVVIRPTPPATDAPDLTQEPTLTRPTPGTPSAVDGDPEEILRILGAADIPENDPADLARRLEGKEGVPPTLPPPESPLQVGERQAFWVTNTDTNDTLQVQAILRYITDHTYFWIEEGISYDARDLRDLAETFETHIYPTNREFFGSEWTPGVDSDPHLYLLYARGLGGSVAGYFSSNDSYNPEIVEYSNGHEMFVLNADNIDLDEEFTYGVLAHEFQHMIHWYRDRNETSWLNEGFSDLAMFLNGYDIGGHDYLYADDPDLQLTDWPNDPSATTPHYGASFLFTTYFLDRFGEDATKAVVADPENGMESIDNVLKQVGARDSLTGEAITADDVFVDWVLANFLQDSRVADGRYTYHNYSRSPRTDETETIRNCDDEFLTRSVNQYGVDYIRIACQGATTLHFEGSTQVGVLPVDAYSGDYAFWSNKGDESDITLTRTFDFTGVSGPLTLNYWTWYDIEEDYDYLYLLASEDGEQWEIIDTPSGTAEDPTGANFGWAYNGLSGGGPEWIYEEVDLSSYAGKKVELRFEYITDAAVNGEGFLLDEIAVPEIDYSSDFETDDGGWEAAGWARIRNVLPQTFRLALISLGSQTTVTYISLPEDNAVEIPLEIGGDVDEVVLVVTGTTRFTRQLAPYRFKFVP